MSNINPARRWDTNCVMPKVYKYVYTVPVYKPIRFRRFTSIVMSLSPVLFTNTGRNIVTDAHFGLFVQFRFVRYTCLTKNMTLRTPSCKFIQVRYLIVLIRVFVKLISFIPTSQFTIFEWSASNIIFDIRSCYELN